MPAPDFETAFDDCVAIFKANIQTQITAMNTEKGDTLLYAFDSTKDFFSYRLPARDVMPNRKAYFLQTIEDPELISIQGATAFNAAVGVDVIINMANDGNDERRMLRYHRILKFIVDRYISAEYKGVYTKQSVMTQVEDAKKTAWLISTLYFSVSVP